MLCIGVNCTKMHHMYKMCKVLLIKIDISKRCKNFNKCGKNLCVDIYRKKPNILLMNTFVYV